MTCENYERLREALGIYEAWPAMAVLRKLADLADFAFTEYGYNCHGHEEVAKCRDRARIIADRLDDAFRAALKTSLESSWSPPDEEQGSGPEDADIGQPVSKGGPRGNPESDPAATSEPSTCPQRTDGCDSGAAVPGVDLEAARAYVTDVTSQGRSKTKAMILLLALCDEVEALREQAKGDWDDVERMRQSMISYRDQVRACDAEIKQYQEDHRMMRHALGDVTEEADSLREKLKMATELPTGDRREWKAADWHRHANQCEARAERAEETVEKVRLEAAEEIGRERDRAEQAERKIEWLKAALCGQDRECPHRKDAERLRKKLVAAEQAWEGSEAICKATAQRVEQAERERDEARAVVGEYYTDPRFPETIFRCKAAARAVNNMSNNFDDVCAERDALRDERSRAIRSLELRGALNDPGCPNVALSVDQVLADLTAARADAKRLEDAHDTRVADLGRARAKIERLCEALERIEGGHPCEEDHREVARSALETHEGD